VAFVLVLTWRQWTGPMSDPAFITYGLTNPGVVKYALITLALGLVLCLMCCVLWRRGARGRIEKRSQEGGAMVEFALLLPVAMFIVLLMAQSSFLMVGNLCVQYSAYCAARTAIVAIPDDLVVYSDEGPNYVTPDPNASAKQRRILKSAAWAVMPISCSLEDQEQADLPELVGGLDNFFTAYRDSTPGWVQAHLRRKWQYAINHTFVELAPPLSGDVYGEAEDIHISVSHRFYLSVPIARTVFAALDDGVELDIGIGQYGLIMRAACTLTNEGVQDYVDEEIFPIDR